jgi:uncharacterized damage-inducible protein DinB
VPERPDRRRAGRFVEAAQDTRLTTVAPGDERAAVAEFLRRQRSTLELKCAGLDVARLARRSVPPSTMSLLGLVRHLADVERAWFRRTMSGLDAPRLYRGVDDDGDFDGAVADDAVVAEAWRAWRAECAFTDRFIATAPNLDVTGDHHGRIVTLREVVLHLIEEYARHNGHADLLRERIDGRVGE